MLSFRCITIITAGAISNIVKIIYIIYITTPIPLLLVIFKCFVILIMTVKINGDMIIDISKVKNYTDK